MSCPWCGYENRPPARFCGGCGRGLEIRNICRSCGTRSPGYCDACGTPFAPSGRDLQVVSAQALPARDPGAEGSGALQQAFDRVTTSGKESIRRSLRLGGVVLARGRRRLTGLDQDDSDRGALVTRVVEVAVVSTLTGVALFLRVDNLAGLPYGLHGDETEYALEAIRWIEGKSIGIWTQAAIGDPSGYTYWMGTIFRLTGANTTTMRLASAIPGTALVPVGYLLVRSLFPMRVAMLSAALTAFGFFFIVQSRIAFPAITAVFMTMLAMWLAIAGFRSRRLWVVVIGGIALGLGMYTFKSYLIYYASVWAAAMIVMALNGEMRRRGEIWVFLVSSLVVALPLLVFYATSGYPIEILRNLHGIVAV